MLAFGVLNSKFVTASSELHSGLY